MLTAVNPNERLAVGRLLEFLSERRPWSRSLWGIGVTLAMSELYEACIAMQQGHLSEASLKRMSSALQKQVGRHPAFDAEERRFLQEQLRQVPRADGTAHRGVRELADRVSRNYLLRWRDTIAANRFEVEHFARSVAAHLLDTGFAGQYLHDLIKVRLNAPEDVTLAQLCELLHEEMTKSPAKGFEVLLAFGTLPALPKHDGNGGGTWLYNANVTDWLKTHGFDTANVRSPAAVVLKVQARDLIGAAQAARNDADRFAARALIATGKPLHRLPWLWVKGGVAPEPMKEASRGVGVKELYREQRIFSPAMGHSIDAALELLAHLEDSSPPAAVAGGWGAIEGLLADPSDRATAADNLATLVACSFPRAELTALSYHVEREHPRSCAELIGVKANRDRSRVMASMILEQRLPPLNSLAEQAAANRLTKLLRNPGKELQTMRESIGDSFHRLYRQRNLILHGGRLDSVALSPSLRTVAKLVGAGMDRITHGHYVQKLSPMALVAKANLALAVLKSDTPLACVDLLEVN